MKLAFSLVLASVLGSVVQGKTLRRAQSAWAPLGTAVCGTGTGPTVTETGTAKTAPFTSATGVQSIESGAYYMAVGSEEQSPFLRNQGGVEVYALDTNRCLWNRISNNLTGTTTEARLGAFLSMKCDATTLAVSGDMDLDSNMARPGFVQVYEPSGPTWFTKGNKILDIQPGLNFLGQNIRNKNFGFSTKVSCIDDALIIGAFGYFQYYEYDTESRNYKTSGDPYFVIQNSSVVSGAPSYNFPIFDFAVQTSVPRVASRPFGDNQVDVMDLRDGKWSIDFSFTQGNTSATTIRQFGPIQDVAITGQGTIVAIAADTTTSWIFVFEGATQLGYGFEAADEVRSLSISQNLQDSKSDNSEDSAIPLRVTYITRNTNTSVVYEFDGTRWYQLGTGFTADDGFMSNDGSVVYYNDGDTVRAEFWPADENIDCYPDFLHPVAQTCFEPENITEPQVLNVKLDDDSDLSNGAAAGIVLSLFALITLMMVVIFYMVCGCKANKRIEKAERAENAEGTDEEMEKLVDDGDGEKVGEDDVGMEKAPEPELEPAEGEVEVDVDAKDGDEEGDGLVKEEVTSDV